MSKVGTGLENQETLDFMNLSILMECISPIHLDLDLLDPLVINLSLLAHPFPSIGLASPIPFDPSPNSFPGVYAEAGYPRLGLNLVKGVLCPHDPAGETLPRKGEKNLLDPLDLLG